MQKDKEISFLSAIREVLVIGIIKIVLAVVVFAFSTVITETIRIYFFQADSWLTDNSQAVSRKVIELYR